MNVIKKDGRIQELSISKIKLSLQKASDDINAPMTQSDIKNLIEDVDRKFKDIKVKIISAAQIRDAVYNVLLDNGFNELAEYYKSYKKE
ncbi:MAG: ATP cone domain-containing protein [Clostridiaceae bacterium]